MGATPLPRFVVFLVPSPGAALLGPAGAKLQASSVVNPRIVQDSGHRRGRRIHRFLAPPLLHIVQL